MELYPKYNHISIVYRNKYHHTEIIILDKTRKNPMSQFMAGVTPPEQGAIVAVIGPTKKQERPQACNRRLTIIGPGARQKPETSRDHC
jgi:hypothetical protein